MQGTEADVWIEKHSHHFQSHRAERCDFLAVYAVSHEIAQQLGQQTDNALIQESCLQTASVSEEQVK